LKPLKAIDQLDYAAEKILEAGGYIYTDPKADEQVKALLVKIEALRDYLGEGEKTMTKSKEEQLQAIYDSHINGNGKQMVNQVDEYGNYDIWPDMIEYLAHLLTDASRPVAQMVIKYNHIKFR